MFSNPVVTGGLAFLLVFGGIAVVGFLWLAWGGGDLRKALERLRGLHTGTVPALEPDRTTGSLLQSFLGFIGQAQTANKQRIDSLRTQMLRAGYFHPRAPLLFEGAKLLLSLLLTVAGIAAAFWTSPVRATSGQTPLQRSLIDWRKLALYSLTGCSVGMLAASSWLSAQVRKRGQLFRHAFPDAIDMLVLCLEGGVGFNAAIQRVTDELQVVHPALGVELNILQREIQLGLSAGDALQKLADRCGLADVRDLALIIMQSERYGASVTKALRIYADGSRQERRQQAEEMAQKAAVKILFPTLLCIFPAIFIVILGPAAFQIAQIFSR